MSRSQEVVADYLIGTWFRFTHVETCLLGEFEDRNKWPDASKFAVERIGQVGPMCVLASVAQIDRGEQRGWVLVKFEWLNTSANDGSVLRGSEVHAIDCTGSDPNAVKEICGTVLERSLAIYADVLGQTGVAGPVEKLAPETDEIEDAEDDESEAPDENQVW
ncbi:MAG: hypothetical protein ACM3UO_00140 [Bacillota bacterium]